MAFSEKERIINYWSRQAEEYEEIHSSSFRGSFRERETKTNLLLLDLKKDETVLDAGSGSGVTTKPLLGEGRKVIAVDFAPAMVKVLQKGGFDARVLDITTMDLSERFDKILAAGVFEYILEPALALKNLTKHLKPSGRIVVAVPRFSFWGVGYFFYHLFFHRIKPHLYSIEKLKNLSRDAGLKVINMKRSPLAWHIALEKI
jgi:SAM-dependent methyltransferase